VLNGTDRWQSRLALATPLAEWRFSLVPSLPADVPLLFLFGTCNIGTGCKVATGGEGTLTLLRVSAIRYPPCKASGAV
jgi:hypothetical protein